MIEKRDGTVYIGGCDARDLAKEYGTPVYVMSEEYIRSRCRQLKEVFTGKYEGARVAYASKAFLTLAICKILEEEGMCLDVVSGGELYTAIKAGFPRERIEFNGNNKSAEEIKMAVEYGVGRIIIDGTDEAEQIEAVCKQLGKKVKVLVRFSPGVDSHTHKYITTGNVDSKFGIPTDGDIFDKVFKHIQESEYLDLLGLHFHIGSQLHENDSYLMATGILLDVAKRLKDEFGFTMREVNIGGGFGIRYTDADDEKPYEYFLEPVMEKIANGFKELDMPMPAVVIEPGRSIAAKAGCTIYSVGTIKEVPGVRTYVSIDGGMTDNIRPALYEAEYECDVIKTDGSAAVPNLNDSAKKLVTVCGKCCESGDILARDVEVADPERGDLLVMYDTGAYCYTMASNYNKIPLLPVVLTNKGESRIIVKRQTYDDLISREVL